MRTRLTLAALALTLAVGACDRDAPTSPAAVTDDQTTATAKKTRQQLIFPANQVLPAPAVDDGVVYTITSIQVKKFGYTQSGGLTVDGVLTYTNPLTGATRTEVITNAPATLTSNGSPTQPTCQILNLDIGAIHLNLLGLVVDLAPVHLDITAVTGRGNLLGNLLCALVGILDPAGPLSGILALLDRINAILSQL